ncbi:hypothetical protein C9374_001434 [Naegleria lovaniensis]|uniref:Arrestin C-terminal-like domain-containing protein n=1 Tax=Naegleria lovaniensis TaxID=51637 RepID=A0AA88GVR8_NAELO|nr:uncharacterized protein C9374_001434 [Naegleria lovaniensis]KAG2387840.1 hypothetical protein C9374_001434 [Naegleria lovaniensis]
MIRAELLIYFPTKLYFSGEKIVGYVELRLPSQMGIYGIKIDVFGREYYTTNLQQALKTNSNTRVTRIFYEYSTKLEGRGSTKKEEREFFGLFKKQVNTVLPAGVYKYDFEIQLPDFIPPTYRTNQSALTGSKSNYGMPAIDYELRCTCMNSDKSVGDLISSAAIPVGGSLMTPSFMGSNSTPFTDSKVKTFLFANGQINTMLQMPSRVFLTGDYLHGQLTLENTSQKTVSECTMSFIQRVDCLKSGQKIPIKSDVYVIKKIVIGELKAKEKKTLTLNQQTGVKVPDFCVESIFPYQKMGTLVNVGYFIKVTGKLSLATDLDYECLLYVANRMRHMAYFQQVQTMSQPFMSAASPSLVNTEVSQINQSVSPYYQQPSQYGVVSHEQQQIHSIQQYQQPMQSMPQQQQAMHRSQSFNDHMKQSVEENVSVPLDGSAPPEQEATEYFEYQDDQQNMSLYPTVERYHLPPIPLSAYETEARRQLEHEHQQPPVTGMQHANYDISTVNYPRYQ